MKHDEVFAYQQLPNHLFLTTLSGSCDDALQISARLRLKRLQSPPPHGFRSWLKATQRKHCIELLVRVRACNLKGRKGAQLSARVECREQ